MLFWNSLAFSMIQQMLEIWSLVPLPFVKPAWTSGSSQFTYCWSLAWRILNLSRWLKWELELLFSLILLSSIFNVWVLHTHVYDFFWLHPAAYGILVSLLEPGWNACPLHWEHRDLTIGPPGSPCMHMFKISNDTGRDKIKTSPHFPSPTLLLLFSH